MNYIRLSKKYYGVSPDVEGYFLDIGANIGTTCIYVKKTINPNLKILAFEMEHENCKQLKCNMILNDISECEMQVVEAAVSNVNDSAECMLSVREDNMGDHRVIRNGNYIEGWKKEEIKMIHMDDWLLKNEIDMKKISYIWMDVQGHEGFVLDGAPILFGDYNIPVIMEFWPKELQRSGAWSVLTQRLKDYYYTGFICMNDLDKMDGDKPRDMAQIEDMSKKYADSFCDIFLIK